MPSCDDVAATDVGETLLHVDHCPRVVENVEPCFVITRASRRTAGPSGRGYPRCATVRYESVEFCVEIYIVSGMSSFTFESTLSVTEASRRGVSRIVADAESGAGVVVERRGKPAAVVVGMRRMQSILEREDDLRSAALVLSRAATDTGNRASLDDVIFALGFDRTELEEELEAGEAAGFSDSSPVVPA